MALDPKTFKDIIDAHLVRAEKEHREWDSHRRLYRCQNWGEDPYGRIGRDDDLVAETGSVYAYTDTMIASVVPPNPQITCLPRRKGLEMAAQYREALVNDSLRRNKSHLVLWKLATHASIYPRGVLKAVWNRSLGRPDFMVIDPRHFFFDMNAMRWEDVTYCIQATVLTKAQFAQRVKNERRRGMRAYDGNVAQKAQFGSYPAWLKDHETGRAEIPEKLRKVFQWTVVFEVWDFTSPGGRYYHMLQGERQPLYIGDVPYVFLPNPFHLLTFNDNLEDAGGMSDVELVKGPVRRLDELRTIKLRFAQSTIPVTVVNEENLDDVESAEDQLENATGPGDMVRLKVKNNAGLADVLGQTPTAQLSPAFDSMDRVLEEEILFRLGMPSYSRGQTGTSDIATELALVDMALRTRQGRRSELINDVITFMARATVGLYEEFMDPESILPVRLGKNEYLEVARDHLAARDPEMAEVLLQAGEPAEEPLEIDYEVVPYSPVENSKTAQLKKIREFADALVGNPHISQKKFTLKLVDLLDLGDLEPDPEEQAAMAMQAMGGMPGAPGAEGPMGATEQALPQGGQIPSVPLPDVGAQGPMVGGAGFGAPEPM